MQFPYSDPNSVHKNTSDAQTILSSILYPLGAVGTPSISFSGDPDTGIWSPAANTLAWSTNGSERARLTSAGTLLINKTTVIDSTSYPTTGVAQLQVLGSVIIGRAASFPVRIHGDGWQSLEFPPQGSGGFGFNCYYNGTTIVYRSSDYAFRGILDASGNFREFSAASGTVGAAISFVEARRVTSGGHTLLKTTTDNGVLTVGGDAMPEADNTRNLGSSSFRWAHGIFGGYIRTGLFTVATLPNASTAGAGAIAMVSDATLTAITGLGLAPTGGGANKVIVYSDGSSWLML